MKGFFEIWIFALGTILLYKTFFVGFGTMNIKDTLYAIAVVLLLSGVIAFAGAALSYAATGAN